MTLQEIAESKFGFGRLARRLKEKVKTPDAPRRRLRRERLRKTRRGWTGC